MSETMLKARTAAGYPHRLLEEAAELARYEGWSEDVYRDLLAVRQGRMSHEAFGEKYYWEKAILVLDMTGLTRLTMERGEMAGLLRIMEAHSVCVPVLQDSAADLIRSFADNLVALYDSPRQAVLASFEVHRRVRDYVAATGEGEQGLRCCVGIGYGRVLKIGPNLAQGDEMNRASKLGEDIARGEETLVTENVKAALNAHADLTFRDVRDDDVIFRYYHARPSG